MELYMIIGLLEDKNQMNFFQKDELQLTTTVY